MLKLNLNKNEAARGWHRLSAAHGLSFPPSIHGRMSVRRSRARQNKHPSRACVESTSAEKTQRIATHNRPIVGVTPEFELPRPSSCAFSYLESPTRCSDSGIFERGQKMVLYISIVIGYTVASNNKRDRFGCHCWLVQQCRKQTGGQARHFRRRKPP
jgi:hypothetical protein